MNNDSYLVKISKFWKSRNKFCCNGNQILGQIIQRPDYKQGLITFTFLIILEVLFIVIEGKQESENYIPFLLCSIIIFAIVLINFIAVILTDPGYIVKQIAPFYQGPAQSQSIMEIFKQNPNIDLPFQIPEFFMPVQNTLQRLKFCDTCKFYQGLILRPPKTSHCRACDACVEEMDHHCPWLGNCIGKRNYRQFLILIYFSSLLCLVNLFGALENLFDDQNFDEVAY